MALPFSRCMHVNKMLIYKEGTWSKHLRITRTIGLGEDLYQNVMENVPTKRQETTKSKEVEEFLEVKDVVSSIKGY
jgi:hypothetical protein